MLNNFFSLMDDDVEQHVLICHVVKNCEGPEFLPCIQVTSEPASVSCMLAEDMRSWVRDKVLYCSKGVYKTSFIFTWATFTPKSHGGDAIAEESKLREPKSFTTGSKQTCLTFDLEGNIVSILLDSTQTCPLPGGSEWGR